MTAALWQRVKEIFDKAASLPPAQRDAYLTEVCRGQDTMRAEVESLLAQRDKRGPFLGMWSSMAGKTLLHYAVIGKLGEGGMGVVYKARDTRLNRLVVLKMPAWAWARPKQKQQLLQEAKCLAALNHPNIVAIYAIEEVEGANFIAMEYVPGQTLARTIPPTGMEIQEALGYARQIVSALTKAHSEGIVHRDFKTGNIIITEGGIAKVLDFGMAGWIEASAGRRSGRPRRLEHGLMGTPDYMSPEQADGRPGDHRSDIFSFGIILYEMLTGTHPFAGRSPDETLRVVRQREAPPLPSSIPEAVRHLVFRCLEKDPQRRFQNSEQLLNGIDKLSIQPLFSELSQTTSSTYQSPKVETTQFWQPPFLRTLGFGVVGTLLSVLALYWLWFGPPVFNSSPPGASTNSVVNASPAPDSTSPTRDQAVQLMRSGRWAEATMLFDEVLRSNPQDTQVLYDRAVCQQNLTHWNEAVSDFSEFLRRNPKNTAALYNRAMCYMNLEKLREALSDLDAVISIKPSSNAYLNRAQVRAGLGDKAGAKTDERLAHEPQK